MKWIKKLFILAFVFSGFSTYAKKPISDTTNRIYKSASPFAAITKEGVPSHYIPQFLDQDIILDRLACIKGEIELPYNENLQQYIKEFVTGWGREHIKDIMRRKEFYFPIFEQVLKENNMPDELKYMAVIESSLKPQAFSYAAAGGLWQFMPGTATVFGLKVDAYVDERMDPFRSTEAACKYMRYLYNFFEGDWHLALAAYNCGEGRVQMAIHAAKSKNFWDVYPFLPYQTRTYVPKFIAMMYVLSYAEEHNFYVHDGMKSIPASYVIVNKATTLQEFANFIDVPVKVMHDLNPHLKLGVIPAHFQNYKLYYPSEKESFIQIYNVLEQGNHHVLDIKEFDYVDGDDKMDTDIQHKRKESYVVTANETLADIAKRYNLSEQNIRIWNSLTEDNVPAGTRLTFWLDKSFVYSLEENCVDQSIKEETLALLSKN